MLPQKVDSVIKLPTAWKSVLISECPQKTGKKLSKGNFFERIHTKESEGFCLPMYEIKPTI